MKASPKNVNFHPDSLFFLEKENGTPVQNNNFPTPLREAGYWPDICTKLALVSFHKVVLLAVSIGKLEDEAV